MFAEIKPCTSQNGRGGGIPNLTGTIKSKATTDDFRSILDIVDEEGKQNFSKNVLFSLYSDHQNVSNNLCKVRNSVYNNGLTQNIICDQPNVERLKLEFGMNVLK